MGRKKKKKTYRDYDYEYDEEDEPSRFVASDLFNILLIFLLVVIFFLPAAIAGKVFFAGDVMNVYNPYQAINAEQLAQGKMPLWTDRFFCGFPLFAESQGALFYPPTRLAYSLAPVSHAFTLDALLHFFLAGAFMYILARYLGQRPVAALFAGSAFAFSGLFCSLIINFTIFRSAVWIPIIFYLARRTLLERGLQWTLLLTLALICQMMGGSLQVTAITVLLITIDVIYLIITGLAKKAFLNTLVRIIKVILGFGFAVGIYAFQLWPTHELTALAWRGVEASYDVASSYSFPPEHLIDIAIPNYYGDPAARSMLPGIPVAPNYFGYFGVIALGLALYAIGSKRSGIFWPIAIVFVILSLGPAGKLFDAVYYIVPFFDKFRAPDRFLIVFIFCASILAGFGAERLAALNDENATDGKRRSTKKSKSDVEQPKNRYLLALLILIAVAVLGVLPWLGRMGASVFDGIMAATLAGPLGVTIDATNLAQYEAWRAAVPMVILYFVAFAAVIPLSNLLFGRAAGGRGLVLIFLIVNCLDLFLMIGNNYNCRLISGKFFAEDPKSVKFIKEENPYARIYSFGKVNHAMKLAGIPLDTPENQNRAVQDAEYLRVWYQGGGGSKADYFSLREIVPPNLSAYFGLYDAGGFASLYTEDFYLFEGVVLQQLRDIITGMSIPSHLPSGRPQHLLIDTMAVEYIISSVQFPEGERFEKVFDEDVFIYRNRMALPRAYVVHPANVVAVDYSNLAQLAEMASAIGGFDFEGSVILPTSSGVPKFPEADAGISHNISAVTVEPDYIKATVEIDRPGVFVLADSYYPGWRAKLDGKDAEILRVNLYYRGVILDSPGKHEIEFRFRPDSFRNGKYISLLSVVLFILLTVGKGLIDRWYRSPEPEPPAGTVRVIRHTLFGRKVTYEEEDDEEDYE